MSDSSGYGYGATARFHPNATPGIKASQKVHAKFIEEMKEKTKRNSKIMVPPRKIPKMGNKDNYELDRDAYLSQRNR